MEEEGLFQAGVITAESPGGGGGLGVLGVSGGKAQNFMRGEELGDVVD